MYTPGKISILLPMVLGGATLFAQNQAAVQPQSGGPAAPQTTVAAPSVYVVAGGVYGTGVYVAPAATLPTQNTGISLSNQSGISLTAPLQTGVGTAMPPSAVSGYGEPGYSPVAGSTVAAGEAGTAPSGRLINDLGPSYYAGAAPTETGSATPSLAEIADKYKSAGSHNVRMYTNADAERLAAGVKSGTANSQPAQTQTPPR